MDWHYRTLRRQLHAARQVSGYFKYIQVFFNTVDFVSVSTRRLVVDGVVDDRSRYQCWACCRQQQLSARRRLPGEEIVFHRGPSRRVSHYNRDERRRRRVTGVAATPLYDREATSRRRRAARNSFTAELH